MIAHSTYQPAKRYMRWVKVNTKIYNPIVSVNSKLRFAKNFEL